MIDRSQGYGLSLHTSSGELGLALSNFRQPSRLQTWNLQKELSNSLHQCLWSFLAPQTWQDIDFLAVAIGPGSFTSIRLGVVTGRILAQQLNIPLFGISTLAAFAWSQRQEESRYLALQMPATRGKLSVAIYEVDEGKIEAYLSDRVMDVEQWQELLDNPPMNYVLLDTPELLGINAPEILSLAHREKEQGKTSDWQEVLPFYGM
jgi:tRNA threonylcarbamoyl adenosine modification protein YeaZ